MHARPHRGWNLFLSLLAAFLFVSSAVYAPPVDISVADLESLLAETSEKVPEIRLGRVIARRSNAQLAVYGGTSREIRVFVQSNVDRLGGVKQYREWLAQQPAVHLLDWHKIASDLDFLLLPNESGTPSATRLTELKQAAHDIEKAFPPNIFFDKFDINIGPEFFAKFPPGKEHFEPISNVPITDRGVAHLPELDVDIPGVGKRNLAALGVEQLAKRQTWFRHNAEVPAHTYRDTRQVLRWIRYMAEEPDLRVDKESQQAIRTLLDATLARDRGGVIALLQQGDKQYVVNERGFLDAHSDGAKLMAALEKLQKYSGDSTKSRQLLQDYGIVALTNEAGITARRVFTPLPRRTEADREALIRALPKPLPERGPLPVLRHRTSLSAAQNISAGAMYQSEGTAIIAGKATAAVHGKGFYSAPGLAAAEKGDIYLEVQLRPDAVQGVDYLKVGEYYVILDQSAIRGVQRIDRETLVEDQFQKLALAKDPAERIVTLRNIGKLLDPEMLAKDFDRFRALVKQLHDNPSELSALLGGYVSKLADVFAILYADDTTSERTQYLRELFKEIRSRAANDPVRMNFEGQLTAGLVARGRALARDPRPHAVDDFVALAKRFPPGDPRRKQLLESHFSERADLAPMLLRKNAGRAELRPLLQELVPWAGAPPAKAPLKQLTGTLHEAALRSIERLSRGLQPFTRAGDRTAALELLDFADDDPKTLEVVALSLLSNKEHLKLLLDPPADRAELEPFYERYKRLRYRGDLGKTLVHREEEAAREMFQELRPLENVADWERALRIIEHSAHKSSDTLRWALLSSHPEISELLVERQPTNAHERTVREALLRWSTAYSGFEQTLSRMVVQRAVEARQVPRLLEQMSGHRTGALEREAASSLFAELTYGGREQDREQAFRWLTTGDHAAGLRLGWVEEQWMTTAGSQRFALSRFGPETREFAELYAAAGGSYDKYLAPLVQALEKGTAAEQRRAAEIVLLTLKKSRWSQQWSTAQITRAVEVLAAVTEGLTSSEALGLARAAKWATEHPATATAGDKALLRLQDNAMTGAQLELAIPELLSIDNKKLRQVGFDLGLERKPDSIEFAHALAEIVETQGTKTSWPIALLPHERGFPVENGTVGGLAAGMFAFLRPGGKEGIRRALQMVHFTIPDRSHEDWARQRETRRAGFEILSMYALHNPEVIEEFIKLQQHPDEYIREKAAHELTRLTGDFKLTDEQIDRSLAELPAKARNEELLRLARAKITPQRLRWMLDAAEGKDFRRNHGGEALLLHYGESDEILTRLEEMARDGGDYGKKATAALTTLRSQPRWTFLDARKFCGAYVGNLSPVAPTPVVFPQ